MWWESTSERHIHLTKGQFTEKGIQCWSKQQQSRFILPVWLIIPPTLGPTDTLRLRQNGHHFTDDIFKCIFLNENVWISLNISLKFVPKVWINNKPAVVQIMAWQWPGDKPLYEPMIVSLLTHICVTRPQLFNIRLDIRTRRPEIGRFKIYITWYIVLVVLIMTSFKFYRHLSSSTVQRLVEFQSHPTVPHTNLIAYEILWDFTRSLVRYWTGPLVFPISWEKQYEYTDSLVQDCGISIAYTLEILQSPTKPWACISYFSWSYTRYTENQKENGMECTHENMRSTFEHLWNVSLYNATENCWSNL